jgi:5-methylcytosine-specific restriction endonuclease McrA
VKGSGSHKHVAARPFRMPGAQSIRSRRSTVTNAFVNSIMPAIRPTSAEVDESLSILGMKRGEERCVYCGRESTGSDHLRPLVEGSRPSGYITEIANLVPCCGRCNSRKGNSSWRQWMARLREMLSDPTDVAQHNLRVTRLESYEKWREPRWVDFKSLGGGEAWDRYWAMYDAVLKELSECHDFACTIRHRAAESLGLKTRPRKK